MAAMNGLREKYSIPEIGFWGSTTGFELNYMGRNLKVRYENEPPNEELGKISKELMDLLFAKRIEDEKLRKDAGNK